MMRPAVPLLLFGSLMLAILVPTGAARAETCTVSATSVAFGNYDPLAGTPLDTSGTVSVTCTSVGNRWVFYRVYLSTGQSGSYNPRAMTNGVSQLNYNLYVNASRNRIWGNFTSGTSAIFRFYSLLPIGSTRTDTHTVYGRIFAGQNVTTGAYLDNITVTVIF